MQITTKAITIDVKLVCVPKYSEYPSDYEISQKLNELLINNLHPLATESIEVKVSDIHDYVIGDD